VTLAAHASEIAALKERKKQLIAALKERNKLKGKARAEAVQALQAMPVPSSPPLQQSANPDRKRAKVCLKAKNPPPMRGSVQAAAQTDSGAGLGLKIVFSTVCILYSSSL
jgi:hypothetical protein